jgi:glycine/D-amino acid oxidase-like deaminating enzyme
MADIRGQVGAENYPYEVLDNAGLRRLYPRIGSAVVGGIYCPLDGCADPLKLLRALHAGFAALGGDYRPRNGVRTIRPGADSVSVDSESGAYGAAKLVLAAGLGSTALAQSVGMSVPLRPVHGQLMVTERIAPVLDLPSVAVRQTKEGSILIGYSSEEIGPTTATTMHGLAAIARDAVRNFPFLADLRIVRTWAALRIMSPDGFPVYDTAPVHPHISAAACHSGVTLAAAHSRRLPAWIMGAADAPDLSPFNTARFDVSTAA